MRRTQATLKSHAEDQERRPSPSMLPVSTSEVICPRNQRGRDGQEMVATSARRRLTTATRLLASGACRTSKAAHRSSIAVKSATTAAARRRCLRRTAGLAGGAGQGLDERRPGREVSAWRDDPPGDCGPAPYHVDLGQLLVIGLVQHLLLECIQPFVELQGKSRRLGVKRADQRVQRADRVAFKLRLDQACLAHRVEGGARYAAQRDQGSGGVVAVHFHGLAQLLVEAEADEHGSVPVDLQLCALAELFRVLDRQQLQPEAGGQLVDDLVGRVLNAAQKGWPASTSCAISDGAGFQTALPE